jgi:hypothetical protein
VSKPLSLADAATDAATQRLADCSTVLLYEENEDDEITHEEYAQAAEQLAAPYCGCATCVVREVIDAAWPFLAVLAMEQYAAAMADPEVRAQIEEMQKKIRGAIDDA